MPRTDPGDELLSFDEVGSPSKTAAFYAAAFGFLCFMPYPAVGVGNNSALQLGNVATIIALLCASLAGWKRLSLATLFLVLTPRCISTVKVILIDAGDASICFKATAAWAMTLLTVVAVQVYAPRHALSILTGIAVATVVHALVGAYQVYSFTSGVFPFADLYVNPSFLSVQDNVVKLARWEQRPFGIFPEPSAMSSSLGPFVIFFTAICFDQVRMIQAPALWQRHLFAAAAAGGLGLIIASRSGHAAPTLLAIAMVMVMWLVRARATWRTYLVVAIVFGVVLPIVMVFAYNAMNARVSGGDAMGNDSWQERYTSFVVGFKAWSERGTATALFGLGPGLSSGIVKDASGIVSVFSMLLAYFYDTGLLGLMAIGWLTQGLMRTWKQARFNAVFGAVLINWTIGVTLTTSYGQLLPLWITLGWLSCWTSICEIPAAPQAVIDAPRRVRRVIRHPRISPWTPAALISANLKDTLSS